MALTENCLLAIGNLMDTAAITTGTEVATLPASNLSLPALARPWRTAAVTAPTTTGRDTTAGRTWLEADFGVGRVCQMVALLSHNLSNDGTWRVRLSNSATFATTVYDSGYVKAWPLVGGFGTLEWGVFSWGDQLGEIEAPYYAVSSYVILATAVNARYLRLDLSDATNVAGYLQAGRAYCGPIWQPSLNMELDWSIGWEDPSEVSRALGGAVTFDERPRYRVAAFTVGHLPESEAQAAILDFMDRRKGIVGDIIFIPQPSKPETWLNEAIYGRQRRLDPVRSPYFDFRRTRGFELEEFR